MHFKAEARRLKERSDMLRRQALAEDAKPRKWAVKGMRTPKDRRVNKYA